MNNSIKKILLILSLLAANQILSFACSCEGHIPTFCESIGKDSEVLTIEIEAIFPGTDSSYSSMNVKVLDIINGAAFDSSTTLKVFGSQHFGGDCLAVFNDFAIGQQLMINPFLMDIAYFLDDGCNGPSFLDLTNTTVDYATYRDSIIACSGITSISKIKKVSPIVVYPNPVLDNLYFESPTLITQIAIYDTAGKLWLNKKIAAKDVYVPLQELDKGIYLLYFIKEEEGIEIKKIIKN